MKHNPFLTELNKHESRSLDDLEDREAVANGLNETFGQAVANSQAFDLIKGTICERGGHLFTQDENVAYFYGLPNNQTFHVAFTPDNSPKMHVTVLNIAPDSQELKDMLFEKFVLNGWEVVKTQFDDILLDGSNTLLLYSYNTLPPQLRHEVSGYIFEGEEDELCFVIYQGNALCVSGEELSDEIKRHTGFESFIEPSSPGAFAGEPDAIYISIHGKFIRYATGPNPHEISSFEDLPVLTK